MRNLVVLPVLLATMLAGCGEVVVFGHVVGERKTAEQPQPAPAASAAPAAAGADTPAAAAAADTPAVATDAHAPAAHAAASSGDARLAAAAPPGPHIVKSVNIVVTPEAAAKVTGDASRFTADALLDAVRTELKSRKLLDEQSPQAAGTAEIVVDGLATRPTSNVILFGYKMLAGTLEGDIRVTGAKDDASTGSRIVAQSKLTLAASGDDKNPLGPLYHRFAVLAADRLAGVESQPQDSSSIPRF